MRSKLQCYKPYGLLKQLPIPKQLWNSISIDFIEKIPLLFGCNMILIIIDWLSKQAIFILTVNTIISYKLVKLFMIYIFSKHNVSFYIMSDMQSLDFSFFILFLF